MTNQFENEMWADALAKQAALSDACEYVNRILGDKTLTGAQLTALRNVLRDAEAQIFDTLTALGIERTDV